MSSQCTKISQWLLLADGYFRPSNTRTMNELRRVATLPARLAPLTALSFHLRLKHYLKLPVAFLDVGDATRPDDLAVVIFATDCCGQREKTAFFGFIARQGAKDNQPSKRLQGPYHFLAEALKMKVQPAKCRRGCVLYT